MAQQINLSQLTIPGSVEIPANNNVDLPVLFQAAVDQRERVNAWTEKQPPMVCSALSVKKIKLAANIICYYAGVRQLLTVENMKYVILKDYNDHLKSVKALKKDHDIKLIKCWKDTMNLCWF